MHLHELIRRRVCSPQWPPLQPNTASTPTGFCVFPGSRTSASRKRLQTVPILAPRRNSTRTGPRAAVCGCRGTPSTCPKWWRARYRLCASSPGKKHWRMFETNKSILIHLLHGNSSHRCVEETVWFVYRITSTHEQRFHMCFSTEPNQRNVSWWP